MFIALLRAVYWVRTASPGSSAATLGIGLFVLGFGLTAWGKYLMPQGPFVEERHELASLRERARRLRAALVERGGRRGQAPQDAGRPLRPRRPGIFGIVAVFPLLRSLGPLPGDSLDVTDWRKGTVLVDSNGRPVRKVDLRSAAS